jgi:acetyl esterase
MFDTLVEVEKFLEIHGVVKGNPLSQDLENARLCQHEYLSFLTGEPIHRSTTTILKLHGTDGVVQISITYPIQKETSIPIVYIRGGGWWHGSLELSSRLVQVIADSSGMPVVSIDFGLAPQFQFPSQINQICVVIDWLNKSGNSFQLDRDHCVMWGESAGGSLALCVADKIEKIFPKFCVGHILFYGNFNGPTAITTAYSKWVWSNYLGHCDPEFSQRAIPLKSSMHGIQRAWLATGSIDPLLNDSQLLQKALSVQNIACDLEIVDNMPHGFLSFSRLLKPAHSALLRGAHKALEFSRSVEQVNAR